MTLTSIIKKLLKKNNTTKYTFKKADHEVVLLKKLEDDTIFYNNTIYEKNFLWMQRFLFATSVLVFFCILIVL